MAIGTDPEMPSTTLTTSGEVSRTGMQSVRRTDPLVVWNVVSSTKVPGT